MMISMIMMMMTTIMRTVMMMLTMGRDLSGSTSQLLQLAHRPSKINPVGPGQCKALHGIIIYTYIDIMVILFVDCK